MPDLFDDRTPTRFARIAVERGIDRYPDGLTYAVPDELSDVAPGERVLVPLGAGNRAAPGYVIEIVETAPIDVARIKPIRSRDTAGGRLPPGLLQLARWISSYYAAPIGLTVTAMLPAAVKRGTGVVTRTFVDLGRPTADEDRITPKQRAVLETLASLPAGERPIEIRLLMTQAGLGTKGPIDRLAKGDLVKLTRRTAVEAAWGRHHIDDFIPDQLTDPQRRIVADIEQSMVRGFSAHLLYGVTGSGKTEVYIRLIDRVVRTGRMALVLVPEISLTPQTGGRLVGRFPDHRVVILHSGLTAAQRHQQWAIAARGEAAIVLGARSAVFAPIPDDRLGLVVVDEEHDSSYKQDQTPRYHGRDVAIRRAQLAGCPIVLGSATPSLESWHNAHERGLYRFHRLDDRAPGRRLPIVRVVDLATERRRPGFAKKQLGPTLEKALRDTLHGGEQALLLLNRRGYATYIACQSVKCGWVMGCDDCDVTVVYHKNRRLPTGGFVRCHHCLRAQKLPATCPTCGRQLATLGPGTQRVEEELESTFPELVRGRTMVRVDSDTMRSANHFHDVLERFRTGEIHVLLGTQMIAKGLDFPGVRLVGVINADTAINLPDFRATERTFQLVSQVAGRSGRQADDARPGLVIVQSFNPDTPAIQLAAAHDYPTFATQELAERREAGLPPITRLARIVVRDEDAAHGAARAASLAATLTTLAGRDVTVVGPAPCPIARIAGRSRHQIELLAAGPGPLQAVIAAARSQGLLAAGAGLVIDVDPVALL